MSGLFLQWAIKTYICFIDPAFLGSGVCRPGAYYNIYISIFIECAWLAKHVNSLSHQRASGSAPSLSRVHNGWVEPCSHTTYHALGSAGPSNEDLEPRTREPTKNQRAHQLTIFWGSGSHPRTREPPKNQRATQANHLLRTRKPPQLSKHSLF